MRGVVRQRLDYSCGVASVVNLVQGYAGTELNEGALLFDALNRMTVAERQQTIREGLSLLDLNDMLERLGFTPAGLKYDKRNLSRVITPQIVFIYLDKNPHFAVLSRIRGNRAYLLDSSRGRITLPLYKFLNEWAGIALSVDEISGNGITGDAKEDQPLIQIPAIRSALGALNPD